MQTVRGNSGISVNNLLASYEGQALSELSQSKQHMDKRFGRHNARDSVSTVPHLRLSNEGFHASNEKKTGLQGPHPFSGVPLMVQFPFSQGSESQGFVMLHCTPIFVPQSQ